ncbi:MAG TPA: hypothetical protein EYQ85_02885 [Candidatus Poseidoniales archaeon]|jgi:hypothetical protein|nr:MAG: hypothetical protein CXT68_02900 [Euryarchaeota archaeon]HIF16181.1 hypothetical protein [Candidatus Poseidoniales archaeon]HIK77887.1 hypothetical protein [Candidatus Poseidoniales archaeon]
MGGDEDLEIHSDEVPIEVDFTDEKGNTEKSESEEKRTRIDKELAAIRRRRTSDSGRRFPSGIEDWVLLSGIGYGILYFLTVFSLSTGVIGDNISESTWVDQKMSETPLDIAEEVCEDKADSPWIHIYLDNNALAIRMRGQNLPNGDPIINWTLVDGDSELFLNTGESHSDQTFFDFSDNASDIYKVYVRIDVYENIPLDRNLSNTTLVESVSDFLDFEIVVEENSWSFLPWVDSEIKKEAVMTDSGPRPCWSNQDLGNWGIGLMLAELGGGRETAMLTGGAAGVPAWWMAFVSLSLSIFSLFLLYPVMYKVYHQDADDMLSHDHIKRVVRNSIQDSTEALGIKVRWADYRYIERDLSIDILIPYENTESTLIGGSEIRHEILRSLLSELAIFRVFKPIQLTVKTVGETAAIDFETGIGMGVEDMSNRETNETGVGVGHVINDYSSFFRDLHVLSRVEDDVKKHLEDFFEGRKDIEMRMATVTNDDKMIFVSILYRPTTRLPFFRFKKPNEDIRNAINNHLTRQLEDIIGERDLHIRARNQISTLADKSEVGRLEQKSVDSDRIAAVAKQEGFAGRMLQTKLFGDILSTVEYTANEKRDFINRWGFWGLIGFVWIPFMASGVLVGAMLGLLSRMNFLRVLWACLLGGSAASITWAYTAEGIVTVMHKYKLEILIPIAIAVFIGMAILHMRSTKARRQAELFEDELFTIFHDGVEGSGE